jgi:hypothetical protein
MISQFKARPKEARQSKKKDFFWKREPLEQLIERLTRLT